MLERNAMNIFDQIKNIIITEWAIDKEMIIPEAHLQNDLEADSLALLNLAESIATKYNIDMQLDDIVDIDTFGELIELVESKIS